MSNIPVRCQPGIVTAASSWSGSFN